MRQLLRRWLGRDTRGSKSWQREQCRNRLRHSLRQLNFENLENRQMMTANAGTLDYSFGDGIGFVHTDSGSVIMEQIAAIKSFSDGSFLAAGTGLVNESGNWYGEYVVAKYDAQGDLDTGFGSGGLAIVTNSGPDRLYGMDVDSYGNIWLVGSGDVDSDGVSDARIVRLTSSGAMDTTFDGDGVKQLDFGGYADEWLAGITIVGTGTSANIVVTATTRQLSTEYDFGVARLDYTGAYDTAFSGDGIVVKTTAPGGGYAEITGRPAVDSSGDVYVAGWTYNQTDTALIKFSSSGVFDTSFGGTGIVYGTGVDVYLDNAGNLLLPSGGYDSSTSDWYGQVSRYTNSGSLDSTFGSGGRAKFTLDTNIENPLALAVTPDNKILFSGHLTRDNNTKTGILAGRLNADGTPDPTFGATGNGITSVILGSYGDDGGMAISVRPDGRILVGGYLRNNYWHDFAVVGLLGDAPTATTISDVFVEQGTASSTVNLHNVFADSFDADGAMTYSVVGQTNAAIIASTAFNTTTGVLTINYNSGVQGTTNLTVRATDTSGRSTDVTFAVTINRFLNGTFDTTTNGNTTTGWTSSGGQFSAANDNFTWTGTTGYVRQNPPSGTTQANRELRTYQGVGERLDVSFNLSSGAGTGNSTVKVKLYAFDETDTSVTTDDFNFKVYEQTITLAPNTSNQTYSINYVVEQEDVGKFSRMDFEFSKPSGGPNVTLDSVLSKTTPTDFETAGLYRITLTPNHRKGESLTQDIVSQTLVSSGIFLEAANWRDAVWKSVTGTVVYDQYALNAYPGTPTQSNISSTFGSSSRFKVNTVGHFARKVDTTSTTDDDDDFDLEATDSNFTPRGNAAGTEYDPNLPLWEYMIGFDAGSNYDYDDYYWVVQVEKLPMYGCTCSVCAAGLNDTSAGSDGAANGSSGMSGGVQARGQTVASNPLLSSDGYGMDWGVAVNWSNQAAGDSLFGQGMTNPYQPMLYANSGLSDVTVTLGEETYSFEKQGSAYVSSNYKNNALTHNTTNKEFIYTDSAGGVFKFYDQSTTLVSLSGFPSAAQAALRGRLKSYTDNFGNVTTFNYDINTSTPSSSTGRLSSVTRTGTVSETWEYNYISSGENAGLVQSVAFKQGSSTVRTAEFTYNTTQLNSSNPTIVEIYGRTLQTATVKQGSDVLERVHYRYYASNDAAGYGGGLKYMLREEAVQRVLAANTSLSSIEAATESQLADYADVHYEFDSQRRVTKLIALGEGCTTCSASGEGEYTYSYSQSSFTDNYNSWKFKTTETLPDGTINTFYTNYAGQKILEVIDDGSNEWLTYSKYDNQGRLILQANPSAVTGYNETYVGLIDGDGGNAQYLADSAGLITTYQYYAGTTAANSYDISNGGGADGYLYRTSIQQGEMGSSVKQSELTYYRHQAADGSFVYPIATETVFRNTDGTGAQTTKYNYTFQTNGGNATNQIYSTTVVSAFVGTAQNGSNATESSVSVNDAYGRPNWYKDAAGFISYTAYDNTTGAVVKTIRDVNTATTSDFANLPSGWTTPSGGGLHLTTNYEVDNLGRTIKMVDPKGNISYTVYNDAANEVRTYRGWDATNQRPTGTVELSRGELTGSYTHGGNTYYGTFSEYLSYSVFGSLQIDGLGRPVGNETINGGGSGLGYTYTTTLHTLSRSLSNAGGQLIMSDQYTSFSGMTYAYTAPPFVVSGAVQETNFERTEYGYDKRGRQTRVLDAEGTIQRTFYDQQDRVVSTWVGTDDTPTTGLWSPTNTSGSDLVQLSSMVYDNGGVGDGNLTSSTQIPGGGLASRTTAYFYDWRNRTVAVKSGVETTTESTSVNRTLSYTEYDNLNQAIASFIYDGDAVTITSTAGVPNQPSSSLLRAKSSTDYDEQGRVYKSTQYEVDQTSGTIGSGTLVTQSFHDIRGLPSKTRDARGSETTYDYDGVGRQTTVTADDPDGAGSGVSIVSQINYDANGNVTSSVLNPASDNFITAYTYDALDRRVTVTQPDPDGAGILTSPVTTYAYNTAGWLETVTDPLSRVSKTEYDRLGRTIKTTLPDPTTGAITGSSPIYQTTYNGVGSVLTTTDALGNVTTYGYNYLHQRTSTTQSDPDGVGSLAAPVSSATYSVGGDLLTTTDPEGRLTTYEYDLLGRQFQVTMPDPDGSGGVDAARMTYTFDTLGGVLTTTDRLSHVTASEYDGYHRLATSINANGEETTFTYDANGNRLTLTDPNGNETSWVYDTLNRLTSETNELNKTRSFTYDTVGRLHTRTDRLNRVIEYVYDNLSRVTAEKWGTTSVTPTTQYTWTYDAAGQMLTGGNAATREYVNTYDKLGRVTQIDTNEFGSSSVYDLNMTYDVNGNRLTRSDAANTATWSYDFLNRAKDVTATGAVGTYGAAFGYNASGQMTFQENKDTSVNSGSPFSRSDYSFDGAGRLQNIAHQDASNNPFASYGYTWDASDRITAVDFLDGVYDNEDVDYAYDAAGQVIGADRTGSGTDETYDYDTNGNREAVTREGATSIWGVGTNNQLTSDGTNSYTYDDEGNLTSNGVSMFYWDHRNRLIEVRTSSTGVMFTYDHNNLRVGKILDLDGDWDYSDTAELDTQTRYYFDGGRMVREVSADGTVENNYLFGMNGQLIAVEDVANDVVEFAYNDHLGSVRDVVVVDAGTAVYSEHNAYDSFGRVVQRQEFDGTTWNVVTSESIVSIGYTGEYFEVTIGLQYNWNRWYNADVGRWISEDPIGFEGGDSHLGRYVKNNSLSKYDPNGLEEVDITHLVRGLNNGIAGPLLVESTDKKIGGLFYIDASTNSILPKGAHVTGPKFLSDPRFIGSWIVLGDADMAAPVTNGKRMWASLKYYEEVSGATLPGNNTPLKTWVVDIAPDFETNWKAKGTEFKDFPGLVVPQGITKEQTISIKRSYFIMVLGICVSDKTKVLDQPLASFTVQQEIKITGDTTFVSAYENKSHAPPPNDWAKILGLTPVANLPP